MQPLIFPVICALTTGNVIPGEGCGVGTMAKDQSHPKAEGAEASSALEADRFWRSTADLVFPTAWHGAEDRSRFYHIDTRLRRVDVYELDGPGQMSARRTAFSIPEGRETRMACA